MVRTMRKRTENGSAVAVYSPCSLLAAPR
jgi:hypothetical protein